MNKKIIVITDNYVGEPGGSEKHLLNLLSGINETFHVDVYQMFPKTIRNTLRNTLEDGPLNGKKTVTLHSRPVESVFSRAYLSFVLELRKIVKENNIDLIISYHEKSDLINFILQKISFQKFVSLSSKRDMGFNTSSRLKKLMKYITCRLDGIVSPSGSIKDLMVSDYNVDPNRAWVIHNGTDLDLYHRGTYQEIIFLREKLQIPTDKKIICCVGTLKPIKGHVFLLQGFAQYLSAANSDAVLVLIGGGEEEERLKDLVVSLNIEPNVIFAGWQKNVSEWIKAVDLFVISSLSEGLSNALVEASAAGLPLLATNVGGNSEVVVNGENGLLVEPSSSDAIGTALKEMLSDPERLSLLGKNSRKMAEEKFSNASMVSRFEQLFSLSIDEKISRD